METRPISGKTNDDEKDFLSITLIKSEVNFARLPFFALSRKDSSNRIEAEYRELVERNGEEFETVWTVTANAKFGYPAPFDKKVHKAIEFLINQKGNFPVENPVTFSLYEICKIMCIDPSSGKNHEAIRNALLRTAFAGIQSKGTFYSKGDRRWIEDSFHLYSRIVFVGETLVDGSTADKNYLFLGDWYLKSLNSLYVKPLDYSYYLSLKSNVAGRLYEFLSLQFYGLGGRPYHVNYKKLCQILPLTEQKYLSKAKQNLAPAHNELMDSEFLSKIEWRDRDKRVVIYYPGRRGKEEANRSGRQTEYNLSIPEDSKKGEASSSSKTSGIVQQLIQRGITKASAIKLANNHPTERIQKQMGVFDWLKERGSPLVEKNPAGFLRKAIEENYQPPREYHDSLKRDAVEQRNRDRREKWVRHREEQISQDIANWDKIPPEERVQGMLDFWIAGQKMNMIHPTQEEIEARKHELIDNLPDDREGKWEYISRSYPQEPPESFE